MIGIRLQNRYRLDAELGMGGMGTVYRAHDTLLDRDVAVKVLNDASLGTEGRARLLREAQAVAKLNHPNIVAVHDAGEVSGTPFIVMELVEGSSLRECPPLTLSNTLVIAQQLCAALDHAHAHGIVHRDLKPENVIVLPSPTQEEAAAGVGVRVKLMDFGLARTFDSRLTTEGMIVGTVSYLAPEQALGQAVDGRTDLYALGVMLYELSAGRLPFTADDPIAVISQHLYAPVVPPSTYHSAILPALDALIVQLLNKSPEDRPPSASVVGQALAQIYQEQFSLDSRSTIVQTMVEPSSLLARIARGRFVARQHEMAEAQRFWQQAIQGEGHVLLISGEPGVGKTRLARELLTRAQITGATVLVGECFAEGNAPYAPLAEMITVADLSGVPASIVADLLTIAPAIRARYPDVPPNLLLEPQAERQRIFDNVAAFVAQLSERAPVLLFIDDVHWADSGSLFLLHHLARRVRNLRVLIVMAYREVELSEARPFHEMLLDLNRERLTARLKLSRFDRDQTCDLLVALFQEEITPEFLDGIYAETDGNPFFVEEVCKALIESGKLTREEGRWQRPAMDQIEIPQSVRVAIELRVAKLPASAQDTLRAAAILGREFEFDVLQAMDNLDEDALIEALEVAERAQLIGALKRAGAVSFAFAHALIPLTLQEGLSALRRQRLHRRAAQAIERIHADQLSSGDFAAALGRHYAEAGDLEMAVEHYLQAAERARGVYAYQEAISHYQHALAILKEQGPTELTRAARTAMKLGGLYHTVFDFERSQQAYQEGFTVWQRVEEEERKTVLPPAPHALRRTYGPVKCLDLTATLNSDWLQVIGQLFSGLVELTHELDVVPALARSWDIIDQGRRYVFHLRPDARWSDSTPVTAHDFEYTWKYQLNPANASPNHELFFDIKNARACYEGRAQLDDVGVRANDDLTLVVELEEPVGHFMHLLSGIQTFAIPRHAVEAHGPEWAAPASIITNGPFRLAALETDKCILVRNPDFHGRLTGNVLQVELNLCDPWTSEIDLKSYEAGASDWCEPISYEAFELLERARQRYASEFVELPGIDTAFVYFNVAHPPFDDVRVRQAFVHAIDRVTMAEIVFHGFYTPALGGFVPPSLPGHSAGIGLPYDPEHARWLLTAAGYSAGRGFPTVIAHYVNPSGSPLAQYLQQQWHTVLDVESQWTLSNWEDQPERYWTSMHLAINGWSADYPDPHNFLNVATHLYAPSWHNADYEHLLNVTQRMTDPVERIKAYQSADRILMQEAPIAPLMHWRYHFFVKPWVKGYSNWPLAVYWKDYIIEPH